MIPTEWRKSVVVSVVAEPYKALCSNMHKGMIKVVEEGLVAEEQEVFRRGRGCQNQVITLYCCSGR